MPTYRLLFARYSWLTVTAEDEDTAIFLAEDNEDIEGHSECGWYLQQSFEMIPGTEPVIHEYAGYEELGERIE